MRNVLKTALKRQMKRHCRVDSQRERESQDEADPVSFQRVTVWPSVIAHSQ